jgi:hypothetical protein
MKCDKAQEFFSDYIESALDRPMTVALETHLSGCEACSKEVADLRQMWTVLDQVPQVEPPADFVWRTTTRLQNELLNRREAEQARPLPWWKRLTPVQSFSYAGIAAVLVVGIVFASNPTIPATGWDMLSDLFHHSHGTTSTQPNVATPPVTPPQFSVQAPGPDGTAAVVTITATSDMPNADVALGYAAPSPQGQMVSRVHRILPHPSNWSAGFQVPVQVQAGGSYAAQIRVFSGNQWFDKTLIWPGAPLATAPLQNVDAYVALQQLAAKTGQTMLVDPNLTTPVSLDLQHTDAQQALQTLLTQEGAKANTQNGVLVITK